MIILRERPGTYLGASVISNLDAYISLSGPLPPLVQLRYGIFHLLY